MKAIHITRLEKKLGYRFRNPSLLKQALVHRSYAHEHPEAVDGDNERLEFLGDAVLSLAMSHLLVEKFPKLDEGALSKIRASLVNEESLAEVGQVLNLGELLLLGKGEERTGGRQKPSLIADAVEAVLGAIYLDGGLDPAFRVVRRFLGSTLDRASGEMDPVQSLDKDYKTQLQELTQAHWKETPRYQVVREEGPDHDKTFHVEAYLNGELLASGIGKTKKAAEQAAAREALERLRLERER